MPTYVYRRSDGSQFELVERITALPLTKCPDTGLSVKRVPQLSSVVKKGTGWAKDGYSKKRA